MITANKSFITLVFTICPPHRFEGVDVYLGVTLLGLHSSREPRGSEWKHWESLGLFLKEASCWAIVFIDVSVSKVLGSLILRPKKKVSSQEGAISVSSTETKTSACPFGSSWFIYQSRSEQKRQLYSHFCKLMQIEKTKQNGSKHLFRMYIHISFKIYLPTCADKYQTIRNHRSPLALKHPL